MSSYNIQVSIVRCYAYTSTSFWHWSTQTPLVSVWVKVLHWLEAGTSITPTNSIQPTKKYKHIHIYSYVCTWSNKIHLHKWQWRHFYFLKLHNVCSSPLLLSTERLDLWMSIYLWHLVKPSLFQTTLFYFCQRKFDLTLKDLKKYLCAEIQKVSRRFIFICSPNNQFQQSCSYRRLNCFTLYFLSCMNCLVWNIIFFLKNVYISQLKKCNKIKKVDYHQEENITIKRCLMTLNVNYYNI